MSKIKYYYEPHGPWIKVGKTGFHYCSGCGLVGAKNKITEWCIDKGCSYNHLPDYKRKLKEFSCPF